MTEFHYRFIREEEKILVLVGTEYMENPQYKREDISKKHFHNLMEVAICREGKVISDHADYRFEPGTILIVPQNMSHAIVDESNGICFWEYVYINPCGIIQQADYTEREKKRYLDQMRLKEYGYHRIVSFMSQVLLQEIAKLYYYSEHEYDVDMCERTNQSKCVMSILEYIENHCGEKICISDIAKAAYISPSNPTKVFKDIFKMSPITNRFYQVSMIIFPFEDIKLSL